MFTLPPKQGFGSRPLDLSVILPCYKDAASALQSAMDLKDFLASSSLSWEVLIVDDGGRDFEDCRLFADGAIRLLQLERNCGKGAAVRAGMLAASGRARVFTDADLPYGIEPLQTMAAFILNKGFHVVLGDRNLPGPRHDTDVGLKRRLASRAYSTLVGRFVTGGLYDTQCGLKGFRWDIAEILFNASRINRFAFDAEIIYLCVSHRLNIKLIPVSLQRNNSSSVRLLRDSTRMLVDAAIIKRNQRKGAYRNQRLAEIVSRDYDRTS